MQPILAAMLAPEGAKLSMANSSRSRLAYRPSVKPVAKVTTPHHTEVELPDRLRAEVERLEADESMDPHVSWLVAGRLSMGDLPKDFIDPKEHIKQHNLRYVLCVSENEPEGLFQWADDRGCLMLWFPLQGRTKTKKSEMAQLVELCRRISTWLIKCRDVPLGVQPFSVHICDTLGGLFAAVPAAAIMAAVGGGGWEQGCAAVTRAYVHRNRHRYVETSTSFCRPPPRLLPNSPNLLEATQELTKQVASRSISNFVAGSIGTVHDANLRQLMAGYVAEMLVLPHGLQWATPLSVPESLTSAQVDEWIRVRKTKWTRQREAEQAGNETGLENTYDFGGGGAMDDFALPDPQEYTSTATASNEVDSAPAAASSSTIDPLNPQRRRRREITDEEQELLSQEEELLDGDTDDPFIRRQLGRVRRQLKQLRHDMAMQ